MIFNVYRIEILKISFEKIFKKISKFRFQKFRFWPATNQFEQVWTSSFQQFLNVSWTELLFDTQTLILDRYGNTKMFAKYLTVYDLTVYDPYYIFIIYICTLSKSHLIFSQQQACVIRISLYIPKHKNRFFDNHTLIGLDNFHALILN